MAHFRAWQRALGRCRPSNRSLFGSAFADRLIVQAKAHPDPVVVVARAQGPIRADMVAEALATPNSRRVIATCIMLPKSAKDISRASGLSLTTVYRQVRRLERVGILVVERCAMTPDGRKYDLYRSRLRKAHLDLDDVGERVRWEAIESTQGAITLPAR